MNTTGQTREEIQEQEDEEDQAPKSVNLDAEQRPTPPPPPPDLTPAPKTKHRNATAALNSNAHRSTSNPSGPVQSKTSYDKKALERLASELLDEGRGIKSETLKQLQSREKEIAKAIHESLGFEKIAQADMIFVSVKGPRGSAGPPMVLKNRLSAESGFHPRLAGELLRNISENHAPVDIEVIRDPSRTIYIVDMGGRQDKDWADMKAEQASRVEVEKYILIKGIPRCAAGRQKAAGYPEPVISILRGHVHNAPVGSADILAQTWTDQEDVILSLKIQKCDLPLPLTVEVNADHEGLMGQNLTFLRQGTFPDDDKVSRVVVDLNQKDSAGKQPAIDEEFVDQVEKAMDSWDGMEMEEVDLSGHSHPLSISSAGGPVFTSAMMPASVISSFQSATAIPHSRSKIANAAIQPGAMMNSSVIKEYASERSLEISEAVAAKALADSKRKIFTLEKKVKKLETQVKRDSAKKHKAKSSYASRARGGTTGV